MAPPTKTQYDETLLYEGKYGEWFRSSLTAAATAWVQRAQCPNCHRTPNANWICICVVERAKPSAWVNRESLVWRLQAACQGADLDIFFPRNEAVYNLERARWRQYCACCEVSGLCTLFAADSHSVGIFGGKLFGAKSHFKSGNPTGSGKVGHPRKVAQQ